MPNATPVAVSRDAARRPRAALGSPSGGGGERLGDAEVGDDGVPAREQHVLGLQVAVHHAVAVRVGERVGELAHQAHRVRQAASAPSRVRRARRVSPSTYGIT